MAIAEPESGLPPLFRREQAPAIAAALFAAAPALPAHTAPLPLLCPLRVPPDPVLPRPMRSAFPKVPAWSIPAAAWACWPSRWLSLEARGGPWGGLGQRKTCRPASGGGSAGGDVAARRSAPARAAVVRCHHPGGRAALLRAGGADLTQRAASALRPGGQLLIRETDPERRGAVRLTRLIERPMVRLGWNRPPTSITALSPAPR